MNMNTELPKLTMEEYDKPHDTPFGPCEKCGMKFSRPEFLERHKAGRCIRPIADPAHVRAWDMNFRPHVLWMSNGKDAELQRAIKEYESKAVVGKTRACPTCNEFFEFWDPAFSDHMQECSQTPFRGSQLLASSPEELMVARTSENYSGNSLEVFRHSKGIWQPLPTLSLGKDYHFRQCHIPVCLTGGVMYFAGTNGVCGVSCLELYRNSTSWLNLSPMLYRHVNHGLCGFAGRLCAFGGTYADNFCEFYDPKARVWQNLPPMLRGRARFPVSVLKDHIAVIGGEAAPLKLESPIADCEVFDPVAMRWLPFAPMPCARQHHASCVLADRLFVMGGRSASAYLKTVACYDPASNVDSAGGHAGGA